MARAATRTPYGWLAGALVVVAVLLSYAPLLGRDFTSEDFLLIRLARQWPPWRDLGALLAGPWLGIEVVRFYRPLAQALLAVEARWFGGEAAAYNLVHLAFHAANALLVHRLAARLLPGRWPAALAALLFALHPFHPNAVSFIASYATLFAGTALFGAAVAWEAWRATSPAAGRYAAALLLYAAATACYEAAVALPLALLLRELLVPDAAGPAPAPAPRRRQFTDWRLRQFVDGRRRRLAATLPFFAVAGLYLLLRSALFGEVVAGYEATARRLSPAGWPQLAADALVSFQRLFHPELDPAVPAWAPATVLGLAASLPILLAVLRPPSRCRELGVWLFAWSWTAVFLAPFAFEPPVPANGRFAYLAAAGAALALGRLAATAWAGRRAGPARAAVSWTALALVVGVGALWATELAGAVGDMRRAGETARRVRSELAALAAAAPPGGPLLVANHPRFLVNASGVPLAQVLRYGLADSVAPPFAAALGADGRRPRTYPLPEGPIDGARAAFFGTPEPAGAGARIVSWDGEAEAFRSRPPRKARRVARIAVTEPGGLPSLGPWEVGYRPVPGAARHRLVVLARGNPDVRELEPGAGRQAAGLAVARVSPEFVRSMRRLYSGPTFGGPVYWWIEARDAGGALVGVSPARAWPEETSE
jgi:hypothetical protein